MKTIYYHIDNGGIWFHVGYKWRCYINYSKQDAIAKFREDYNLKRKHIHFINTANMSDLMSCIKQLASINEKIK